MRPAAITLAAAALANTVFANDVNNVDLAADVAEVADVVVDADAAAKTTTTTWRKYHHKNTWEPSASTTPAAKHHKTSSSHAHKATKTHEPRDEAVVAEVEAASASRVPCSSSAHASTLSKKPCPTTKKCHHPVSTGAAPHANATVPNCHGANHTAGGAHPTAPHGKPPVTGGAGVSDKVVPVLGALVAVGTCFLFL